MPSSTHSQLNLDFATSDAPPPLALTVRLTPRGRAFIPRLALERFLAEGD